jgi:hypothetical protein
MGGTGLTRRLGLLGVLGVAIFALALAARAPSVGAAVTPTYNLDGTWTASAIGCNDESETEGNVQITEWSATTGRFQSATETRAHEFKSAPGLETGSTVTLTILSAPGAQGLLPGRVFKSGSSLTITLSIVCKNGTAGSYTLVNRNPGAAVSPSELVAPTGPPAPAPVAETQVSQQEHDLSSSCARAKEELLRDITDNMLGLSFAVATPGKLEATVLSGGAGAPAATAPGILGCETVFSARAAGAASVGSAAQTFTVAKLSQAFVISGKLTLHIPLTGAGRKLIKKLHAADSAYHRKHPHGHSAPSARFKLMLRYTPAA